MRIDKNKNIIQTNKKNPNISYSQVTVIGASLSIIALSVLNFYRFLNEKIKMPQSCTYPFLIKVFNPE